MIDFAAILKDVTTDAVGSYYYYPKYSGRGMFGQHCVGIVGSREELNEILKSSLRQAMLQATTQELNIHDALDEVIDYLFNYQIDNMGKDLIYYFPGLQDSNDEKEVDE